MKLKNTIAFLAILCLVLSAQAQSVSFGYRNPVLTGMNPDPSICRVGEDYYTVTSTFTWFPGVPIYHSKDLINWKLIGYCLTRKTQLDLSKGSGIYAPTIRYNNGTFYMVTTNQRNGGNFYVTATNPAGPWSEPIWVKEQPGIDPSLFFDDDGKVYFTSTDPGGIAQAEIDIKTGKFLTPIKIIWTGTGGRYPEGPHLYKIKDTYYLMISEGGTEYGHMLNIARSKSPWGPFEANPDNPILTHRNRNAQGNPVQGVGHADWVQAQDGSWWMVFLGFRQEGSHHHIGRETFLSPFTWSSKGWPVLPDGGTTNLVMKVQTLAQKPFEPLPKRDEFDRSTLEPYWNFLKNPDSLSWSLTDRKGWLRLKGNTDNLSPKKSPAFLARRQQHLNSTATVSMEFNPQAENEEAGLTIYHRDNGHYDVFIRRKGRQRFIVLRYKLGSIIHEEKQVKLQSGAVQMRVNSTPKEYRFSFSQNNIDFQNLGSVETRFISSETLGGFVGAFVGVYATGNGKLSTSNADVDWFEYEGKD
ncbi:MAG: glycoside hydrolase family 43 protein [Sphingobacteriaceae bacterium]|nr:glycoside hydrolase family 43 protein [Sphingobacteriaceae bacterium]